MISSFSDQSSKLQQQQQQEEQKQQHDATTVSTQWCVARLLHPLPHIQCQHRQQQQLTSTSRRPSPQPAVRADKGTLLTPGYVSTHLPSGRYLRMVKGIFFSRNSLLAICKTSDSKH
jgi:predicted HD phosphohydrolase